MRGSFMALIRSNVYGKLSDQKGVTTVQFAIVCLLFFILLFGIIEFGLLMYNQQVITNAGREGARAGIVARPEGYEIDANAIIQIVTDYAMNYIVTFGNKQFNVDVNFDSGLQHCEEFRDLLTVTVTYDYHFLFLPFATQTLETRTIMICE